MCILRLAKKIEKWELEKSFDTKFYEKLYQKIDENEKLWSLCLFQYNDVCWIPSDSETIRHLKEVHGKGKCSKRTIEKDVEEIYGKYTPFQCIAYW